MPHNTGFSQQLAKEHRTNWPKNQRASFSNSNRKPSKKKLALLLPAYNEELLIQTTIKSALAAGQKIEDIYVVDDFSTDKTRKMALSLLGKRQVLSVEHSGKAGAVHKAIQHFNIVENYQWLHIADADSIFGVDYFKIYRKELKGKDFAAAVGFVQSLRGNWICRYRAFSYTYGQHIIRRFQSWFGMISVMPGPITSYRTEIIPKLDFLTDSLREDFDITLQIHRHKLGKIKFIPGAVNYTQDPQTLKDFWSQTQRWYRGFFQGVMKYKIGTKAQRIDISVGYQLIETLVYLLQVWVLLPVLLILSHSLQYLWAIILSDMIILGILGVYTSAVALRPSILVSLPTYYFLRWVELVIYVKTFIEVVIQKRFKTRVEKGWETTGRRYALTQKALSDTTIG